MNSLPTFGSTVQPTAVPSNSQVVIPQITIPQYSAPVSQIPVQGPQLHKVTGMDGAKRFVTQPNAMYALFDEDDDVMYIKVTDKNNYPVSLTRYRFYEEAEPKPEPPPEYVTKEEYDALKKTQDELLESFNSLKEELNNAKQSVRSQTSAKSTAKSSTE